MPYWLITRFTRSFVLPLTKSISERVEEFHIAYIDGEPEQELKQFFSLHKLNMSHNFLESKITRFFMSRKKLYSQIKDVDFDVIFTLSSLWMQESSRYFSRKLNIPYVVRLRGNHREVRKSMRINLVTERILNYLETRSLKDANLVIPNSKDLARKANEWGIKKENITLPVYNGVDTQIFKPMNIERSNEFTVAYAGRIRPEKRVPDLLRIAEKLIDVHFIIAGKNYIGISFPRSVEYLEEIPFSEMPKFYNKADLIVLPSVTEGLPNVVLEAYACGKPVLVTREAIPEELEVFGSVTDLEDFGSEIEALKKSDLKTLGRRARSYVEKHFTWDKFAQSTIKLLEGVVD